MLAILRSHHSFTGDKQQSYSGIIVKCFSHSAVTDSEGTKSSVRLKSKVHSRKQAWCKPKAIHVIRRQCTPGRNIVRTDSIFRPELNLLQYALLSLYRGKLPANTRPESLLDDAVGCRRWTPSVVSSGFLKHFRTSGTAVCVAETPWSAWRHRAPLGDTRTSRVIRDKDGFFGDARAAALFRTARLVATSRRRFLPKVHATRPFHTGECPSPRMMSRGRRVVTWR